MFKRTAALTVTLLLASAAWAQNTPSADAPAKPKQTEAAKKLGVGDKAPEISIEKWVKGDPITGFEKGQVYIVEFWATWCGPCIASMPHLSEIQKDYKDKGVRIIGVTSKDSRGNTLDAVEKMVKDKGDTMGYTVAWDTAQKTSDAYLRAAGQNGIPCSFLVDGDGKIAYIGHPMWLDYPLAQVVAGKWDPKAGMEEIKKAKQQLNDINRQLQDDPEAALKAYDDFSGKFPAAADGLAPEIYVGLLKAGKTERGVKMGQELIDKAVAEKNAVGVNEIVWYMVDPEGGVTKPDLAFALKGAEKACELSKYEDGAIIDTLARVHFIKGDTAKAIELQTKAVEKADARFKSQLEATLKEYQDAAKKGNK